MSARDALNILLKGTGLTFQQTGAQSVFALARCAPRIPCQRAKRSEENAASSVRPSNAYGTGGRERDEPALAEVVVTAEKRTERAQDVPAALQVMSGEVLQQQGSYN